MCAASRAREREPAPRGNVQWRHVLAVRVHRAAAADADRDSRRDASSRSTRRGQRREQRVAIDVERGRRVDPCGERAVVATTGRGQLGTADIDSQ